MIQKIIDKVKDNKYIIILGIVFIAIIIVTSKTDNTIKENPIEEIKESISIMVDVKGAVNNPGVYTLETNSRVEDAIKASGGVREDADISMINLSKILNDEDVVIIYSNSEINQMIQGSTSIKIVEKECICPKLETVGCIDEKITNIENSNSTGDNKISLSNASKSELETLPGIGSSKADLIIQYRKENNGFKSIEELKNIKGIGEATFEKLKDYITI